MKKQSFEPTNDGKETDRFIAFAKKVISVPKSEIDAQIEKELGWDVEHVPPVGRKKWTAEEFAVACNTRRRASEHERDAARLAITHRNKGRYEV